MKIILDHIDDRFAPDMSVTLVDAKGNTLDSRRGYCEFPSIARIVAKNAIQMLRSLDEVPPEGIELLVRRGNSVYYGPATVDYIQKRIDDYLAERGK